MNPKNAIIAETRSKKHFRLGESAEAE